MLTKQQKKHPVRTYLIAYDANKKLKSRGITVEGATPAEVIAQFERYLDSQSVVAPKSSKAGVASAA